MNPRSPTRRSFANPKEMLVDTNLNRPDVLAVEIPAGNGIGTPRAIAAAYSAALDGRLGLSRPTLDALSQPAQPPSGGLEDVILSCYAPNRLGTALLDQRDIALRNALFRDVLGDRPRQLRD